MCGVAGVVNYNSIKEEDKYSLERMSNAIKHRGPDDEKYFYHSNVAFAFRRLAINDLKDGEQPFYNEDKTVCIMVNGEIYNHIELRKMLKGRHEFSSKSDCEVIVHLYEEIGLDFLSLLVGMYSISIFDIKENKIILAKDRFGIKPLYYHFGENHFIFSSEIKGVLTHHKCPRQFDLKRALQEPWVIGSSSTNHNNPISYFEGIENLSGGSFLTLDVKNRDFKLETYWDIRSIEMHGLNSNQVIEKYIYLLEESVKNCLMSDVDVGVFLSGGIDSIAVSKLAAKYKKIDSFSVFSQSTMFNGDSKYSLLASKEIGIRNFQVLFNNQNLNYSTEDWKKLLWLCENPMTGPEQLYKYHLHRFSKSINPNLKVMLTGQGSDEFNGGYSNLYTSSNNWEEFVAALSDLEKGRIFQNVPSSMAHWDHQFGISPFRKDFLKHLYPEENNHNDYLNYVYSKYRDIQMYNCWHEDRTASGNHIENRVPFLDHRIVELSIGTSTGLYNELFMDKKVLREGLKRANLSISLINRPKVPFYYGNGVQSTHKMMMEILMQDNFSLIEEAFESLGNFFDLDSIINIARNINKDIEFENIEFLTRLVNIGLLYKMVKSSGIEVAHPSNIRTLPHVEIKDWDHEKRDLENLFENNTDINLERIPKLDSEVELLKPVSESKIIYIIINGELKYLVEEEENSDWYHFLLGIDNKSSIRDILFKIEGDFNNISNILDDALRTNLLALEEKSLVMHNG